MKEFVPDILIIDEILERGKIFVPSYRIAGINHGYKYLHNETLNLTSMSTHDILLLA